MQTAEGRKHLVLVGGGHTHVLVLRALGMQPEPGLVVTVIAKEISAPYSGMLPGYVAGHYGLDDIHIDVVRLAQWANVRLVHGVVESVDRAARRVHIAGREPLGYDLLSIDIGITPRLGTIVGADAHGIPVKPVSTFAQRWQALEAASLSPHGPRRLAVIGTGAAGFELILSMRHRLMAQAASAGIDPAAYEFALVGSSRLLPSHNAWSRAIARRELTAAGVKLIEHRRVAEINDNGLRFVDDGVLPADAVLMATDAGPAPWLRASGLPVDERGFLAVRPTLQVLDDDDVFGVGDCATVLEHPREKAGVFAVRQGPPLTDNLRRRLRGQAARPFTPQRDFLTLLSLGDKRAIAARNGLAISGGWVWRWKDNIDRAFMEKFEDLPRTASMSAALDEDQPMPCAGCGAKVGPLALGAALDRLGDVETRDDAIVRDEGHATLALETVDYLPAFWPEPYLFGEIAAHHAMSDIFAMGGAPERALATVVLPYGVGARTQEDLYQVLAGARAAFRSVSVRLEGGHSSVGPQMAAGFFVAGSVQRAQLLRKSGLNPGHALVLTRPIGSGLLFAGMMRGQAPGGAIAAALDTMRRSNGPAARVLWRFGAAAATDVTGFGLAGHLLEMLDASRAAAAIDLGAIRLYPSALDLARAGVASTLVPENARVADRLGGDGSHEPYLQAVLFDPQTAGGLLAAIPANQVAACVAALRALGEVHAAHIGEVVEPSDGRAAIALNGRLGDHEPGHCPV